MFWIKRCSVILIIAALIVVGGCAPAKESVEVPDTKTVEKKAEEQGGGNLGFDQPYGLLWGTMTAGSPWQVLGTAFLEDIKKSLPNVNGSILPTNATTNLLGVQTGEFNIGFSLSDRTAEAWDGTGVFEKEGKLQDIRCLFCIYPHSSQTLVWADSPIETYEDLVGKRITTGPRGSSSEQLARPFFGLMGYDLDNDFHTEYVSFSDAIELMKDGHLDAWVLMTAPVPSPYYIELGSVRPIRLLDMPENIVEEMSKFRGVDPYILPGGVYENVDYPTKAIRTRMHTVVHKDFPEQLAYDIVKIIAENFDRYGELVSAMKMTTVEDMAADAGIPFHPGALKYFEEQGWAEP
jgi:TRAP transporter TAXI family solute receptor